MNILFGIILMILFILAGVTLVHFLQKKGIHLNRWLFGVSAFLVVLIPEILLPGSPQAMKTVLYLLSGLLAVMFFETGRLLLEKQEMRGVVKQEQFSQRKGKQ